MPKNKVSDPITDQESAFGRLVLSGTMTDRHAAEAVGLNPDSAAYTKSKPHVRAYMLQHRAAVEQQLVQKEADLSRRAVDGLHRLKLDRDQVLDRLWELAKLNPEMTRGSITGQVKAISMIVAMENFIPNRRAVSSEKKSDPTMGQRAGQQATAIDPQPSPAHGSVAQAPPAPGPSQSTFANRPIPSKAPVTCVPLFTSIPDLGVDLPAEKTPLNPFVRPR